MQRQGLHPNRVTLLSLLEAASQLETLKEGRSVHGYAIRRGIGGSDEVFETSVVDINPWRLSAFCQVIEENFVQWDSVCACLNYMRPGKSIHGYIIRAGMRLDLLAATTLVDLYSKSNKLIQSRELFDRMEKRMLYLMM
ncbi:hypothetical protein C1H46_019109 [Malus baccata]|uniref:Pentatricopeptide repeat-containing protein n=1 Tax=Malus baccata TaxID=106549 RepID=A0A540M987_MALBA|nr:hypothetical protein C1H46_019109 [Malus baccata]